MIVRTSPVGAGKLVRVTLAEVAERHRLMVSRRLRERLWDQELGPGSWLPSDPATRARVLLESVFIERAALRPSRRGYYVPVDVAEDVIAKHGSDD